MSKPQNVLLAAKTVSKTQKSSRCKTVKSPLRGASQWNGVENPKGLSMRNVSSLRPLLSPIYSVCRVYTLTSVCLTFWSLYTPFDFIFAFGSFGRPYLWLRVHAPLRASPYGILTVSKTSEALWGFWPFRRRVKPYGVFMPFRRRVKSYGFFIPFHGEWHHLGFSVRFAAMDTFWVLRIIRGVLNITCVFDRWVFIYLFIYVSFIHLFT